VYCISDSYCTEGWVDVGIRTKIMLRYVHFYVKVWNTVYVENSYWSTASAQVQTFKGHAVHKGQKYFFYNLGFMPVWVSNDPEFNVNFKYINYLSDNMQLKKVIWIWIWNFSCQSASYLKKTCHRCIVLLRQVTIFETFVKFCVFWYL
jgi:hypothetical protein